MSCFKCGHPSHFARDCMNIVSGNSTDFYSSNNMNGMSDNLVSFGYNCNIRDGLQRCYRCDEVGHIARECSSNNDIRICYNCGRNGHIRTECTAPLNMNSNLNMNTQCYRCGQFGHFARDCSIPIENNGTPLSNTSIGIHNDRSRLSIKMCFKCSRTGHIAATCPDSFRTDMRDIICYCCNRPGHIARDCTDNRIFSSVSFQPRQPMIPPQLYPMHMPMMN